MPQASIATKNLSGARSGTLSEGGSITGGHLHHPGALHDEEGVTSRKQGYGLGRLSPLVPVQSRTGTNVGIGPGS